ncbi:MAG: structural protein P5 [Bacteroidaceae bacterium]|nr:structural protein P5 [Bacteroidaceae bacterium]MBR6629807.1 structural protein P5 [Bacteroidaceae bacterium]
MARGIDNCNPLNIEKNSTRWQGLRSVQTDRRFFQFISMEYGYRAAFITLSNYRKLHGLYTLREWINRWAPAVENPTDSYLNYVARKSRVGEDEDLHDVSKERFCAIVAAMSRFENGIEADMLQVIRGYELAFPDKSR